VRGTPTYKVWTWWDCPPEQRQWDNRYVPLSPFALPPVVYPDGTSNPRHPLEIRPQKPKWLSPFPFAD